MRQWTERVLTGDVSVSPQEKERWLVTLNWYLGYCAKESLGDPTDRENGKVFWRHALEEKNPAEWQKKQWGEAMSWFYTTMIPLDQAGREMRSCLRRRNVRYNTEKSYMAWLRRFQAFLYPRSAMEAQQADAVAFLTHLAENEQIASSTQDQCFSTLVFFFRHVLDYEEVVLEGAVRGGRDQAPAVLESRRTVNPAVRCWKGAHRTVDLAGRCQNIPILVVGCIFRKCFTTLRLRGCALSL